MKAMTMDKTLAAQTPVFKEAVEAVVITSQVILLLASRRFNKIILVPSIEYATILGTGVTTISGIPAILF